jgi:hypothetical protein
MSTKTKIKLLPYQQRWVDEHGERLISLRGKAIVIIKERRPSATFHFPVIAAAAGEGAQ